MTSAESAASVFWDQTEAELAETRADVSLVHDQFYSERDWDVYRMYYSTTGGHRLFAWLSAPKGPGPFPALLRMPDYASVHDIIYTPLRQHAVVMNATHRGQRNSDGLFQASFPGLLTEGIDSPETYVMRSVFADALRAVEVLTAQDQVGAQAMAVTGSGLGGALALAAASRRSVIKAVAADTPMALGHRAALQAGLGYPLAELGDYLRMFPGRRNAVERNLAVLEPLSGAEKVTVPVLLSLGRNDRSICPLAFGEELADRLPNCDLRVYEGAAEGGGHEHAQVRTAWLAGKLGIA